MIPSHRQWFNRNYSPERYARFLALMERACGEPVQFRHSETPCFLPAWLIGRMTDNVRDALTRDTLMS